MVQGVASYFQKIFVYKDVIEEFLGRKIDLSKIKSEEDAKKVYEEYEAVADSVEKSNYIRAVAEYGVDEFGTPNYPDDFVMDRKLNYGNRINVFFNKVSSYLTEDEELSPEQQEELQAFAKELVNG